MNPFVHHGQWATLSVGLVLLCMLTILSALLTLPTRAQAAENLWQSTFGQRWFHESRSWRGQHLAGTSWESSLTPDTTYKISFQVNKLDGVMGLHVGNRSMIAVNRTGWHSYEFKVWQGSKRQLLFTAERRDVTAGVSNITVRPKLATTASSAGPGVPKGHYVSFARERNMLTNVLSLIDEPWKAASDWALDEARDVHGALTTPGVKGFAMRLDWRTIEKGDGEYDWRLLDANVAAARRLGLKFVVQVGTRSFDGDQVVPNYFPPKYSIWTTGGGNSGFVAKLWDPWVHNRLIKLHKKIAWRYANDAGFGGIATSESAVGNFWGGNYSQWAYRQALTRIASETQAALKNGKLFWYLNFVRGGDDSDMRKDARANLVASVPHHSLVLGGPDITPDRLGMPGNVNSYRVHVRKTQPNVQQFCHMQHVDQGLGGVNRKTNKHRSEYLQRVQQVRNREKQSWHTGPKAIFQFDDLRNPNGQQVNLHPQWVLGDPWKPQELFDFAMRNFDCDYFFWHFRKYTSWNEFDWWDIRPVIVNRPNFYQ